MNLVHLNNFQVPKFPKIKNSESLKLPKMTFLDRLNSPKLDFTKNQSGGKIIKFRQSQALTSHFESFWSIVQILLLYWTSALWCSKKYTRRYVLILQWILFCIRDAFIGILILPGIKYLVHSISYKSRKPIKLMNSYYFRHQL